MFSKTWYGLAGIALFALLWVSVSYGGKMRDQSRADQVTLCCGTGEVLR